MARRPYAEPTPIVRPPLTPNDAARVAGTLKHGDGRHPFLRHTVDMIERAEMGGEDALLRLRRFIQDWQHHARAPMLVELGDVLAYLIEGVGPGAEEQTVGEAKIQLVDDILAKVTGFDDLDDIKVEHLVDAFSLLDALAEEYEVKDGWQGFPELRERLIDDRVKADDGPDQVAALKAEVDTLKAEAKALREERAELRDDLRALLNAVGRVHVEASKIAEDRFGVTPLKATT